MPGKHPAHIARDHARILSKLHETQTNEPAERLRDFLGAFGRRDGEWTTNVKYDRDPEADFDAALAAERQEGRQEAIDSFTERLDGLLAAERRATVERIRAALKEKWPARDAQWVWVEGLREILDAEAQR